jgi:hypothetical protein
MTKTLNEALLAFQGLQVAAQKDGKNPHFRSNYSTLESVISAVSYGQQFGLCFTQEIDFEVVDGDVLQFVRTSLIHAPSGGQRQSRTPILTKDKTDPQKMGSGISYSKRYGLQSIFGIPSCADDDDGNAASARPAPISQERSSPHNAQAKSPVAESSLSQAAGATPLTLAQKIANTTSLQELNNLYIEYKDKIEAATAEMKTEVIDAFSVKKSELKG